MLTPEKVEEIKKELMKLEGEAQQKRLQEILSTLAPEEREQLVGKQECPFCLMAQGKIPVKTVYEDEDFIGILDINPANPGHVLFFPKEHAAILAQVPEHKVGKMFSIANRIATAVFDATGAEGTNIVVANGAAAGQTAPHMLVNIIPRFKDDGVAIGWQPKPADEGMLEELVGKIKGKMPKKKSASPVIVKEDKEEDIPRIP